MLNIKHKRLKHILKIFSQVDKIYLISAFLIFTLLITLLPYFVINKNKIMPGVYVSDYYLGGLTKPQAQLLLSSKVLVPKVLKIVIDNQEFEITLSDINFSYDFEATVDMAFKIQKTGIVNPIELIKSPLRKILIQPVYNVDEELLREKISEFSEIIDTDPIYPYLYFKEGRLEIERGKPGKKLEENKIISIIRHNLDYFDFSPILINSTKIDNTLNDEAAQKFLERGKKTLAKSLDFKFDDQTFSYKDDELIKTLDPFEKYNFQEVESLTKDIAEKVNQEPQDSVFIFDEGRVKEFVPSKDGVKVKEDLLAEQITNSLNLLENGNQKNIEIEIPVDRTLAKITTKDINNLGIKELIGKGESKFAGSITSRIHNIALAASKLNGVLIAPNEVFSFNKTLGDVSIYTGYQQAYIIKEGQTVLGDGGGVCQVSTTLFRAALNTGLPIIERRAHSYRVSYYEQGFPVGLDATVYDPTTDLKIKNNTPGHILIQTKTDTKNKKLTFELYGTFDGRVSTVSKPVISDVMPPPEDLYIDDPTLPLGQIKQIDYKAGGAKVRFNYKVEREGVVIFEKTFFSNYQPWQAKYLRGVGNP